MTEFEKYATRHRGINSTTYAKYTSAFNKSFQNSKFKIQNSLTPYIVEERQLNVAQMDVFSRLMMDRIIFLGTAIKSNERTFCISILRTVSPGILLPC